jgi:hypothetical protein
MVVCDSFSVLGGNSATLSDATVAMLKLNADIDSVKSLISRPSKRLSGGCDGIEYVKGCSASFWGELTALLFSWIPEHMSRLLPSSNLPCWVAMRVDMQIAATRQQYVKPYVCLIINMCVTS